MRPLIAARQRSFVDVLFGFGVGVTADGPERLGYHVTIQAINPDTGELLPATA